MSHGRHQGREGYVNGLLSKRTIKTNIPEEPSPNRLTPILPSTFQPGLKRQQSLSYDKNIITQRLPDPTVNNRGSVKAYNNQSKRLITVEQQKRL